MSIATKVASEKLIGTLVSVDYEVVASRESVDRTSEKGLHRKEKNAHVVKEGKRGDNHAEKQYDSKVESVLPTRRILVWERKDTSDRGCYGAGASEATLDRSGKIGSAGVFLIIF